MTNKPQNKGHQRGENRELRTVDHLRIRLGYRKFEIQQFDDVTFTNDVSFFQTRVNSVVRMDDGFN